MRYFENISLICISKRQILYTYFIDERNVSRKKKRTFREKYASKRNELIEKNNMKLCLIIQKKYSIYTIFVLSFPFFYVDISVESNKSKRKHKNNLWKFARSWFFILSEDDNRVMAFVSMERTRTEVSHLNQIGNIHR